MSGLRVGQQLLEEQEQLDSAGGEEVGVEAAQGDLGPDALLGEDRQDQAWVETPEQGQERDELRVPPMRRGLAAHRDGVGDLFYQELLGPGVADAQVRPLTAHRQLVQRSHLDRLFRGTLGHGLALLHLPFRF